MTERPDAYKPLTTRVDVSDDYDVMLWGLVLGVSAQTVIAAVKIAGSGAVAVQAHLTPPAMAIRS
jgi:hypothetical protein